jgi:Na+/H+-translocating membrane pyrophosphatase
MLDSLGNTTAATGKGFAIGSAALTAMALLAAYVQVVQTQLTMQAEKFAHEQATAVSAPSAIYEGHGIFAVVFPGAGAEGGTYVDGAMYKQGHDLTRVQYRSITPGAVFPVRAVGENPVVAFQYQVVPAGDLPAFTLTSTRQGSIRDILDYYNVSLTNPKVLGGLFVGAMLTFVFCALTMNAVGRAAYRMMNECRRQFGKMREAFRRQGMTEEAIADPEHWPKRVHHEGVDYPDYANCVSISTAGAQREMILPALLAIVVPIVLGLILGVAGVMGMLAGGLVSGFAVAVFMANAGGAWDNAKKLLESYGRITAEDFQNDPAKRERVPAEVRESIGARAADAIQAGKPKTIVYGKGSNDHKATVVGDTVGDPFKDTSGPSLNILIKLISIVSVVFAGLIVRYGSAIGGMLGLE